MIRFIDMGNQLLLPDEKHFAFYDTITDRFLTIGDGQVFSDAADFGDSCAFATPQENGYAYMHRCALLIPVGW